MSRSTMLGSFALLGSVLGSLSGQPSQLWLQASDVNGKAVQGIRFSLRDHEGSTSDLTDVSGRTRIVLGTNIRAGSSVLLTVIGKYWIADPLTKRVVVPPFDSGAVTPLTLVEDGKQVQLGPTIIRIIAEQATAPTVSPVGHPTPLKDQFKAMKEQLARQYKIDVETLDSRLDLFSSDDPYVRGVIALVQGRYIEAIKELSTASQNTLANTSATPEQLMKAAFFLGQAQYMAGDYRQAAEAYRQAATAVPDDPALLNSLALALFRIQDFSGAESGLRSVLKIREREVADTVADPFSEELAIALSNLGYVLSESRKCADAKPYLVRALAIWEKRLLPGEIRLANEYENVGKVLCCQGLYDEADSYFQRGLEVWEVAKGSDHPSYGAQLYDYAILMRGAGRDALAEPAFKRALEIFQQKSPSRASVISILRELGGIRFRANDSSAAEQFYTRALNEEVEATGPDSSTQIGILEDLLDVYEKQRDATNLERCYRRLLNVRMKETPSPSRDRNIAIIHSNWAILVYNQGDYERARPMLKEAESWMGRAFASEQRRLSDIHRALDTIDKNSADRGKRP